MSIKYKVLIEKVESGIPQIKREWVKVADSGNKTDGGAVYDYATYEGTTYETTEILKQTVEKLDVAAVIRAVNEL